MGIIRPPFSPLVRLSRRYAQAGTTGLRVVFPSTFYCDLTAVSVHCWFYYHTAANSAARFLIDASDNTLTRGWRLQVTNSSSGNRFRWATGTTPSGQRRSETAQYAPGAWYHIVARDSDLTSLGAVTSTIDFVINGVVDGGGVGSSSAGGGSARSTGTNSSLTIGNLGAGTANSAPPGAIALVAVWNYKISDAMARALYLGASPLDYPRGLLGFWRVDGQDGVGIERDLSPYRQHVLQLASTTNQDWWAGPPRIGRRPSRSRVAFAPAGGGTIGSGDGRSQSDSAARGAGAAIASGAASSIAASVAFAVGVAIFAGSGVSSSPSAAAGSGSAIAAAAGTSAAPSVAVGSGAARAAGAGASTSSSSAFGSNDNIITALGVAIAPSVARGTGAAIAAGDGRSTAPSLVRGVAASIAAGSGCAASVSIVRASAASIAAGSGAALSVARVVGDVSPPFDASTLVRAPHYLIFDQLETSLDFDELATWTDFDELATQLVFLTPQGAEIMGELKLIQGEVRDVEYVVRGAGGAPLDLTNSTTRKLTVRVPGATPRVDQVDVTVVGAGTNGRLKYAANAALAGVAGRYKALTVITYPGGVIVKSPGEVLVDSAIV